jgi:hypothetical protein
VMAPASLIGELAAVTITRAGPNSLFGERIATPAASPELATLET